MTEKNIDNLISMFVIVVMWIILGIIITSSNKSNSKNIVTKQDNQFEFSPNKKNAWDKLNILAKIIAAIAAFIFSIIKLIELINNK